MKPKLYSLVESPAVRSVLITIKYLGIDVDRHEMDWQTDFVKPEFLKVNPQHTVPTLVDENGPLWDSHAINVYLLSKYAKNDDLYPNDIYERAIVNQRMYFEGGAFYYLLRSIDLGYINQKFKEIPKHFVDEVKQNYDFLEKFLEGNTWVAGKKLSIADFSMMTTATSLDYHVPIDPRAYPNITSWLERVQKLPCCSEDAENLKAFKKFLDMCRS